MFRVNFYAPLVLARGLIEELKSGAGSIVNVTSIAGSRVHPFASSAYATSKAALATLTREMAADFGSLGVRVNAIAPGEIRTAMIGPEYESLAETIPLRRLGDPRRGCADHLFPVHRGLEQTSTAPKSTSTAANTSKRGQPFSAKPAAGGFCFRERRLGAPGATVGQGPKG